MSVIEVSLPPGAERKYKIHVGVGVLSKVGSAVKELSRAEKVLVLTDTNVAGLWLSALEGSLSASGLESEAVVLEAGEASKSLETLASVLSLAARAGLKRSDAVISLGGGVVGDIAGLASALYMRSIGVFHAPTSLVAMLDASVGGKTAVNLPEGKNLCGCFCQPLAVLADTDTLSTLPERELLSGMAEAVKCAAVASRELFEGLENASVTNEKMIYDCIDIKRRFVEADEHDTGARRALNFGHTVGHALEALMGYGSLTHGEAVGIGMVAEARRAGREQLAERTAALLEKLGLPTRLPVDIDELFPFMLRDKKSVGGAVTLAVPSEIGGKVEIIHITEPWKA